MLSSCIEQIKMKPVNQKQVPWYELPEKRWRNNPNQLFENDSQRQKLYDAESLAKIHYKPLAKTFSSLEEIQKFINKLTAEAWFRKRFGQYSITVKGKKGYGASARRADNTVWFSNYSRSIFAVLHEVAHIAKKRFAGAAHGRFFARTVLELVEHVIGVEAAKILRDIYKKGRVKYLPKRELSEEAREKLRQNFINNVLKQKVEV